MAGRFSVFLAHLDEDETNKGKALIELLQNVMHQIDVSIKVVVQCWCRRNVDVVIRVFAELNEILREAFCEGF